MRTRLASLAALAAACLPCGCGISDPYNSAARPARPPARTTPATAVPADTAASPLPGAPVVLRFARLAANVSAKSAAAHFAELIGLTAPPLRGELIARGAALELAADRGLATGARMVASVSIETMEASGPRVEQGRVVVDTREQQSDGASEPPLAEVYDVTVTQIGSRWGVAEFQPQP
jgi:poly(3-hydroxybutyrate) depolymerase